MSKKKNFILLVFALFFSYSFAMADSKKPSSKTIKWVSVRPVDIMILPNINQKSKNHPKKSTLSIKTTSHKKNINNQHITSTTSHKKNINNTQKQVIKHRLTREQTSRFRYLMNLIISPCCFTQPVALHPSSASDKIKKEVRQFLISGYSNKQIIDYYVKQYGERILSVPRDSSIYLIPIIVSIFIILITIGFIRRWHKRSLEQTENKESPKENTPPKENTKKISPKSWYSIDN